jgi:signal transduction histidine kinase
MLRDIVRCLQVLAEEKKQTMTLEAEETVKINANPTAIRQAITNLLDNAIKYTPEHGCICLSVKQYSGEYASVTIRDNGPGIAARHQQHVFERFYRIDENRSSASGGTGLGLAIAQQAVERNGGQIKLESEPGNGCTFTIQFTTAQKER